MKIFLHISFLLISSSSLAQKIEQLQFKLEKITIKEKVLNDSLGFDNQKANAIQQFKLQGYTGIFIKDSVIEQKTKTYTYGYAAKFNRIKLMDERGKEVANARNYYSVLSRINQELETLENHGFPFAQLKVTNEHIKKNGLILRYKIDTGSFFSIGEIIIKSKKKVNNKTIHNLINVHPDDVYSEQRLKRIDKNLINSGFYKLVQPTQIIFDEGKAKVYIFIEAVKSSSADGYVGLQQDQLTGRLALNGYINLTLNNAFKRATKIDLNWRNNPDKTQLLKFDLDIPYLFSTPMGIGTNIDLQKQDTSFIRSNLQFYLGYRAPTFQAKVFTAFEQSSLLSDFIPDFRPFSKRSFGVGLKYSPILEERLTFYQPSIELESGFFSYRNDTIQNEVESPLNINYMVKYSHEINFFKYFILGNSLSYSGLYSETDLALNELVYFGGLRTLRGFYELELVGNEVWILANEIVFKPVDAFELKLIYDYSHFVYRGSNYTHSGGIGFGLNTGNSTLEIVIANGNLNENPFLLTNTKVHIGFKANF